MADAKNVQSDPIPDSPPTDPLEALVEVYYQVLGYITSSNKWFWYKGEGKKQRGYQDIDVLALNDTETLIVSVTANLDDKIRWDRGNNCLNKESLDKVKEYFERVDKYLKAVEGYKWLWDKERTCRKIIVYATGKKKMEEIKKALESEHIELLSIKEIIKKLKNKVGQLNKDGFMTKGPIMKTFQLLNWGEEKD